LFDGREDEHDQRCQDRSPTSASSQIENPAMVDE
jgi:hypothetical protein